MQMFLPSKWLAMVQHGSQNHEKACPQRKKRLCFEQKLKKEENYYVFFVSLRLYNHLILPTHENE